MMSIGFLVFRWVAILGLVCTFSGAISSAQAMPQYVAVIDAGSSGSRIYLYAMRSEKDTSEVELLMEFEGDAPGLSSFKANPREAGVKGLAPLLQRLSDFLLTANIPKKSVKVEILATGGMRLLEEAAQNAILDNIRTFIQATTFSAGEIETISGQMEGVYSWIDVNYLLGNFQHFQSTVGIIEVGGASAQIAFEVRSPISSDETIRIGLRNYRLFVKSFLGLGRNEARKLMFQISNKTAASVDNPCYPTGLYFDDQKAAASEVTGSFNYSACVRNYEAVLANFSIQSIRDRLQASPGLFAAVGAGSPVGTFWGLLDAWKIRSYHPFDMIEMTKAKCGKSWIEFESEYGGAAFNKSQCADSVFIGALLYGESGLRLKAESVSAYRKINNQTPTWTRGFVVSKYLK